jgi:hypothetical protein
MSLAKFRKVYKGNVKPKEQPSPKKQGANNDENKKD